MGKKTLLIIVAVLLAVPTVADAQDWVLRVRAIAVEPNDSSDQIGDTGSEVAVDSATTIEVDVTYMLSKRLGLELIAATPKHDLSASGGALSGADLGSVKLLPPTLTLQFHPFPGGLFDLYVGAGVNYTTFYSYDLSGDLADLGVTDLDFDNSFGLAGNIGLNVNLGRTLLLNGDIKYIQVTTTADIQTADGTLDSVDVDINPWVFGLGVGFRF